MRIRRNFWCCFEGVRDVSCSDVNVSMGILPVRRDSVNTLVREQIRGRSP